MIRSTFSMRVATVGAIDEAAPDILVATLTPYGNDGNQQEFDILGSGAHVYMPPERVKARAMLVEGAVVDICVEMDVRDREG